jgi:hypothetical protein
MFDYSIEGGIEEKDCEDTRYQLRRLSEKRRNSKKKIGKNRNNAHNRKIINNKNNKSAEIIRENFSIELNLIESSCLKLSSSEMEMRY